MLVSFYAVVAVVITAIISTLGGMVTSAASALMIIPVFIGVWVGLLVLHVLLCLIITAFVDVRKPCTRRHGFFRFITAITVGGVLSIARVRTHVSGEKLPECRFLLVSNHISNFDPMICMVKFRKKEIAFVSKPENFKIPVAGPFIHMSSFLPIDRENPRNAMRTINAAAKLITDDCASVGVYPEGTRSKTGELLEFHNGVMRIAQKAHAPIVVATIKNSEKIARNFPLRHTDVYLNIAKIIAPEEYDGMRYNELGDMIRNIMIDSLKKN